MDDLQQRIGEELIEIVSAVLGARGVALTDRLIEDLDAESMDIVNVIAAVEDRYSVTLEHEDVAQVYTVGDVAEAVFRIHGES